MSKCLAFMCFALAVFASAKPGYEYQKQQQVIQHTVVTSAPVSSSGIAPVQQTQPQASSNIQPQSQLISTQPQQYAPQAQYVSPLPHYTVPIQTASEQQHTAAQVHAQGQHQQPSVYAPVSSAVSSNQFHQHPHQQPQKQTIITKEIFIHGAPEETEVIGEQQENEAGPAHKKYRILFIKPPVQNLILNTEALKHAAAANEEKTVIYVLSKKPDLSQVQSQLFNVQNIQKSSKPEVFFIKYKTVEEANQAQQDIQAQYDGLDGSIRISPVGTAPTTSVISNSSAVAPTNISPRSNVSANSVNAVSLALLSGAANSDQPQIFKKFLKNDGSSNVSIGVNAKYLNAKKI